MHSPRSAFTILIALLMLPATSQVPVFAGSSESIEGKELPPVFKSWEQAKSWVHSLQDTATKADANKLSNLKPRHPRLIISASMLERLRRKLAEDKDAAALLNNLKEKGDAMLTEAPVAQEKSAENNMLEISRLAQKRIVTLAGLYLIEGKQTYLKRAKEEMKAIATMSDWNPNHFLDVAEMTTALALGYDWLYDSLTKEEEEQFRTAILELGLKQGLKQYTEHKWWTFSAFNWNIVCNGGLIVGALAIGDKHPDEANRIVNCARLSVPYAMASYSPDGGWAEGPGYWCYTTKFAMLMFSSLKSAMGKDFGWMSSPGFAKTGFYRIHYTSPTGEYFNFADSSAEERRAPQMFWMSREFKQPLYAGAESGTASRHTTIFHLLFYPESFKQLERSSLARSALFKGAELGFFRSDWSQKNALYLGFKGGDNRASHANLDLGTFVLDWSGIRWACELGPDNYSLPGYFGDQRFSYYRLKTEGQNTFTIDDGSQNTRATAKITTMVDKIDKFFAAVDLSKTYPQKLAGAKRTFVVRRKDGKDKSVVITDILKALKPVSYTWHMHTEQKVEVSSDGKEILLSHKNGKHLSMRIVSPADAIFRTKTISLAKPQFDTAGLTDIQIRLPLQKDERTIAVELCLESP
ncbi:DUF4962 domain-containing protein [bacterium]|nr:DUF4962 domain-containing protein [bacterium]